MTQNEKTKVFTITIVDTAIKLGFNNTIDMLEALSIATVEILSAAGTGSDASLKEIVRIYTEQINQMV